MIYSLNQRGALYVFLTFLFIGVILGLITTSLNAQHDFSQTTFEVSVLNTINA